MAYKVHPINSPGKMARPSLLYSTLLLLICCTVAAKASIDSTSHGSNPIILATYNSLSELDSYFVQVIGNSREARFFARFAHRYGKKYETKEEIKLRFKVFSANLDLIRSTNEKKLSYSLAVNQFADLTWEEFAQHRLGAAQNCSATTQGNHKLTDAVLPDTKDWRNEGIVSPVKDQGMCGSCWTFSTTGALEAAYAQKLGESISLSEQQLIDCARGFDNNGCRGGLPSHAFEYVKYNGGLDTEDSYPYIAKDGGACKFSADNVGVKVIDSVNITQGAEDELKDVIANVRPVSIAFEVVKGFRFYREGVYTSETCGNTNMDVNHAVVVVGYGVENSIPYWLIKNSWGKYWGDHGYFKMEFGKNMCGVATCASYPVVA